MAQPNSAQREPSMEEILASIRRIIEDNDAADRGRASAPEAVNEQAAQRKVLDAEPFREEERENHVEQQSAPAHSASQAPRMTEAVQQYSQPAPTQPVAAQPVTTQPTAEPQPRHRSPEDIMAAIENSRAAREDVRALLGIAEPATTAVRAESPSAAETPRAAEMQAAQTSSLEALFQGSVSGPAQDGSGDTQLARNPLLSGRAERQVAECFAELSEAFAERSRRTFDEMAAQMISPMLREWMDNNLPTLVERLVREEIVRVARGG